VLSAREISELPTLEIAQVLSSEAISNQNPKLLRARLA
jgi:hypothetical protein